jgi:hypothetical protein
METLITELVKLGVPGVIAATTLWWAYKKDRQMETVYQHWVKKTERQTTKYHEFSAELTEVMKELANAQERNERTLQQIKLLMELLHDGDKQ